MDATQAKQLADCHWALTSGPLGAEQVRWSTGMQKLDAILTKLGVEQADLDDIQAHVAAPINVAALAAALAPLLSGAINTTVGQDTILGVLTSPEGQAALVNAANTAEDH